MKSLQGQLLVASSHLPDANFYRSVVLMIQHNDEGALGLILNRPAEPGASQSLQDLLARPDDAVIPVHTGGPVPGPFMVLHTLEDWSDIRVLEGLHMTAREEALPVIVGHDDPHRVFAGYAGWGAGQLEREMQAGGWVTIAARADDVFGDIESLWSRVSRRIDESALPTRHFPDDPSVN